MLCCLDAPDVLSRVENTIKNQVKKNILHTIKVEKVMVFFLLCQCCLWTTQIVQERREAELDVPGTTIILKTGVLCSSLLAWSAYCMRYSLS